VAGSLATLRYIIDEDLVSQVKLKGEQLKTMFIEKLGDYKFIGDIRGRGLFIGIELVKNKTTKQPFSPSLKINQKIKKLAMDKGLMCYPMGGTIDGIHGDHILIAPGFEVNNEQMQTIVSIINEVIRTVTTDAISQN